MEEACPSCGATAVLPIVYGMPVYSEMVRLDGQVFFAGCCVPEVPYAFTCGSCHASWGRRQLDDPEPLESTFDWLTR